MDDVTVLEHRHIPQTCYGLTFLGSMTKQCSEKPLICKHRASHCKSDKSIDRGIEKWFPGLLAKASRMSEKCVTIQRKTVGNSVF
jgi:hypothetical protein